MSFKRIKFIDPVESLSGKRNKNSKTCFFQGKQYGQRGWGVGERKTPVTTTETQHRQEFAEIAKKVAIRRKNDSETYEQDVALFMAQKKQPGGYQTFQKWLFHDEMSKL